MDTLIIAAVAALLLVGATVPYVLRLRRQEVANRERLARARAAGLDEPPTLHPVVDPNLCVGSATCVAACPQGTILGLIDGRAALLNPSLCVGHGQCAAACPVEAVSLVFGTARRGVDIPYLEPNFQTSIAASCPSTAWRATPSRRGVRCG
ncbi:MAG: ferredoxin family protein [Candidatus Latescibacterota bacterium]